ncbi:MAG: 2Fe-2S iron-sulfur cluster-binding protein, partial [Thermodesulfobacteriota bacterium]|nr:2Fe-2S iron-sulfur cluster-binding protein [Thermodesulfobacteriota bacterium]
MDQKLSLTIDGKKLEASPGQTILEVARGNGIHIPTLCYYKGTTNVG